MSPPGPDPELAKRRYGRYAKRYDHLAPLTRQIRRRAVEKLDLQLGQTVIDVACGTGLTFPLIMERIGPSGQLLGVDLSREMLDIAGERAQERGWHNVVLIEAPAEEVSSPQAADAAVFVLTHDVLQSRPAIENIVGQLGPGARIAVAGAKRPPWWNLPTNIYLRRAQAKYITTTEGLERPWAKLAELVPNLEIEELLLGGAYLAWGVKGAYDAAGSATPS